jgi:hypothetical protein
MQHGNFHQADNPVVGVRPAFEKPEEEVFSKTTQTLVLIALLGVVLEALFWLGYVVWLGQIALYHLLTGAA